MTMTVSRLHKMLGALIEAGHGRKPVLVNKPTFRHPLESDGAVMLDVAEVTQPRWIGMCDDDGGTKWNRDGSESGRTVVLLLGEREPAASGVALPSAVDALALMREVHDVLASTADSDLDHFEREEEEREAVPVQYAARKLFQAIQLLEAAPGVGGTDGR